MSGPIQDGGPAFPVVVPEIRGPDGEGIREGWQEPGMSLRDWFAGQAMVGLLANPNYGAPDPFRDAKTAFQEADAMLDARKFGPLKP